MIPFGVLLVEYMGRYRRAFGYSAKRRALQLRPDLTASFVSWPWRTSSAHPRARPEAVVLALPPRNYTLVHEDGRAHARDAFTPLAFGMRQLHLQARLM